MAQVDIYWWQGGQEQYWHLLCGLIAKAVQGDYTVMVLCASADEADTLDSKLWSNPAHKFIPHKQAGAATETTPVLITHNSADCKISSVPKECLLINLSDTLFERCGEYGRVAVLLCADNKGDERSEQLLKACKELGAQTEGYAVTEHNIKSAKTAA